jgi:hypothetical protein
MGFNNKEILCLTYGIVHGSLQVTPRFVQIIKFRLTRKGHRHLTDTPYTVKR